MSEALRPRKGLSRDVEVVRLGGSLLLPNTDDRKSPERIRTRLDAWRRERLGVRVWIAGTGVWGDELRRLQEPLALDDATCHWAAIGLMSAAATILSATLSGALVVADLSELGRRLDARDRGEFDIVFDVGPFLRDAEPALPGAALPQDWSVTSDSIAARLAVALGAPALTLIKSCLPPESRSPQRWSEEGLVDPFFPQVVDERLELRWIDLSGDRPTERRYPPAA